MENIYAQKTIIMLKKTQTADLCEIYKNTKANLWFPPFEVEKKKQLTTSLLSRITYYTTLSQSCSTSSSPVCSSCAAGLNILRFTLMFLQCYLLSPALLHWEPHLVSSPLFCLRVYSSWMKMSNAPYVSSADFSQDKSTDAFVSVYYTQICVM